LNDRLPVLHRQRFKSPAGQFTDEGEYCNAF